MAATTAATSAAIALTIAATPFASTQANTRDFYHGISGILCRILQNFRVEVSEVPGSGPLIFRQEIPAPLERSDELGQVTPGRTSH